MKLGLRTANQQFARVMRAVRAGREVVLTDRGQPLAVIRRIRVDDTEARLASLSAEGLVAPALRPGPMPQPSWRPEPISDKSIVDTIHEDRDETA